MKDLFLKAARNKSNPTVIRFSFNITMCLTVLFLSATLTAQTPIANDSLAISAVLSRQQDSWNKGNLVAYMQGYWQSDSLIFVGKNGLQFGWEKTLRNYQKSYPDTAAMGKLKFSIERLEVFQQSAFMLGQWRLTRTAGDLSGYFTLLWKKLDGHWYIVLDHSS
jgi:ketosteroid isomerase-like protein